MFKSLIRLRNPLLAIALALSAPRAARADAEFCNFPFGKPQKKMVDGKAVPALENKGQLILIADHNNTLAMLVFDKKQDQVRITLDGKPGMSDQKSGNLVVLDGRQIKNSNQIVINVTKDEAQSDSEKAAKIRQTFQYVLIRLDANSVSTEKGRSLISMQTRQCGVYFQTYYPPLDELSIPKAPIENPIFNSNKN